MSFDTVDQILDLAIKQEEQAAEFYTDMARRTGSAPMKEAFLSFAGEEKGHKAKLLQIKQGQQLLPAQQSVAELNIGEHLVDIELSGELDYQQALILAMKAEKAAYRLYTTLATATSDGNLKRTLLGLAQEEAKHKLRFEVEYDDHFYREM